MCLSSWSSAVDPNAETTHNKDCCDKIVLMLWIVLDVLHAICKIKVFNKIISKWYHMIISIGSNCLLCKLKWHWSSVLLHLPKDIVLNPKYWWKGIHQFVVAINKCQLCHAINSPMKIKHLVYSQDPQMQTAISVIFYVILLYT